MSKYIEELDMNKIQGQAFSFGFVGLSVPDSLKLMDISENEFNDSYQDFYSKGIAFAKFQTLQKLMDVSEDGPSLREYMAFRANSGFMNDDTFAKAAKNTPRPVSTAEVIAQLKKCKPYHS